MTIATAELRSSNSRISSDRGLHQRAQATDQNRGGSVRDQHEMISKLTFQVTAVAKTLRKDAGIPILWHKPPTEGLLQTLLSGSCAATQVRVPTQSGAPEKSNERTD